MGSDPSPEPDAAFEHSAAFQAFTSQGYAASNDEALTRATAAWLEEQAVHPFLREVAARSFARMAIQPGESVLDVGCGTGVFLPGLAGLVGRGGRVVGLDHAPAFLNDARNRLAEVGLADQVELVEGDAHHLPFPDATFDVAHCERVLMHLEDPAATVREMCRVVRPGGRILVAEVYAAGARIAHPDLEAEMLISAQLVSGIRNSGMGLAVRGLLVEAGLRDVGGEVVSYFEEELDQDEAEEWSAGARGLAARGRLDPARVEAAIAAMEESRTKGTYCGTALIFVVSGRVPGGSSDGG